MGKRLLGFNDLVIYKDQYWVACNNWNGLYKIDNVNEDISFISEFPGEKKRTERFIYADCAL